MTSAEELRAELDEWRNHAIALEARLITAQAAGERMQRALHRIAFPSPDQGRAINARVVLWHETEGNGWC